MKVRAGVTAHVPIAGVEIPARAVAHLLGRLLCSPDVQVRLADVYGADELVVVLRRPLAALQANLRHGSKLNCAHGPGFLHFLRLVGSVGGHFLLRSQLLLRPERNSRGLALQVQQTRVDRVLASDVGHLSCKHGGVRVALLDLVRFLLLAHHDCPVQVRALLGVVPVVSHNASTVHVAVQQSPVLAIHDFLLAAGELFVVSNHAVHLEFANVFCQVIVVAVNPGALLLGAAGGRFCPQVVQQRRRHCLGSLQSVRSRASVIQVRRNKKNVALAKPALVAIAIGSD